MFPDPSRLNEAEQTIDQALETCRPACVTTSFQSDGMVLIHLLTQRLPEIPVLFVDTGYHFAETYKFRNRMAREFDLNLINLYPKQTVAQPGIAVRNSPPIQFRPLLPDAKSRTAMERAETFRYLVFRVAPRAVAHPGQSEVERRFRPSRKQDSAKSEPLGVLDISRYRGLFEAVSDSQAAVVCPRLSEHRL